MKIIQARDGFDFAVHLEYGFPAFESRIVGQSHAIGHYKDAVEEPGSSYLWVGEKHHLNREEVKELVEIMSHWLKTGRIK